MNELPSHWKVVEFDRVASLRKENTNPNDIPQEKYVGLEHIDSGDFSLRRWGEASEVRSSKSRFYPGDILYGKLRPYLDKAVIAEFEGICSTDILVFNAQESASSEFLVHLVHTQGFLNHAIQTTSGVNHPRTSWSSLKQFEFPLPPIAEQKQIAHTLQTIQQAKQTRQRELALEQERKAALMQHLFTYGFSDSSSETRKTRFGKVPASWKELLLEECAAIQTGTAKGRKLGDVETIELPYLRVANVQDGYLDLTEIKTIFIKKTEVDRYLLKIGDVLLTEGGDFDKLGRGFIWQGEVPTCVHQNHVFAVRAKQDMILPDFLVYLTQSRYGKNYFLSVAHRTTNLASINSTKLKNFPALLPSLEEQMWIIEMLQSCDRKLAALQREIAGLEELFRAMLAQLMTGQLSVLPLILAVEL